MNTALILGPLQCSSAVLPSLKHAFQLAFPAQRWITWNISCRLML